MPTPRPRAAARRRASLLILLVTVACCFGALALAPAASAATLAAYGDIWTSDYDYYTDAGEQQFASLYLSNEDEVDSSAGTLSFTLPAGASYVGSLSSSGVSCGAAGATVTCSVPSITSWDYASVRIEMTAPTTPGAYAVDWAISSTGDLWLPASGRLEGTILGPSDVDLWIRGYASSTEGRSEVRAGIPFVVDLRHGDWLGQSFATPPSATVSFVLPEGLSFTGAPGPAQVPQGTTCAVSGQRLDCTGPVPTTSRSSIYAGVVAAQQGSYRATASITTTGNELDPGDNTRETLIIVHAAPPADQCTNVDGFQGSVPTGMLQSGTTCTLPGPPPPAPPAPVADACANLGGDQATLPDGFGFAGTGRCVRALATNDRLAGDDRPNRLYGGGGNDQLYGGIGDDLLDGGAGADRLFGGKGADRLVGAAGNDQLTGDAGTDRFEGGAGNDVINARDRVQRERVACGAGRDKVTADRRDAVGRDCEVVQRR